MLVFNFNLSLSLTPVCVAVKPISRVVLSETPKVPCQALFPLCLEYFPNLSKLTIKINIIIFKSSKQTILEKENKCFPVFDCYIVKSWSPQLTQSPSSSQCVEHQILRSALSQMGCTFNTLTLNLRELE